MTLGVKINNQNIVGQNILTIYMYMYASSISVTDKKKSDPVPAA